MANDQNINGLNVLFCKMFAAPFFQNFFMFAAPLQCTLVVWYSVYTTMTNGGTGTVPPLVMEMQTGSTNNHISKIFFVHVSSTNVMVVLVSSTSTNGAVIKRIVMLAAPILINRSMTNYCAGVSENGNIINPRGRPKKKEKRTSITTV